MTDDTLFFEDLAVGSEWTSPKRLITEEEIHQFAELTGDRDPLHVDPVFAAATPYRRNIAHGLLGLSFLAGLSSHYPRVRTIAFVGLRDWQFVRPIYPGDSIHAVTRVQALNPHGRKNGEVIWERQLINQNGFIVQHGCFVTLVSRREVLRVDSPHSLTAPAQTPSPSGSPSPRS